MFDYLSVVYGGISGPGESPLADGKLLAQKCLAELNAIGDRHRFPPRFLILLVSPAYLDRANAEQLLEGVHETFDQAGEDIPLIGSSVAAVFFKRKVHPQGALLVCLASKLIEARVACGEDARHNPQGAINDLLRELELDSSEPLDPNPLANRLLLTFLPGCSRAASDGGFYPAPELHRLLYEGVQARITLFGGVSSANDLSRVASGLQFAGRRVLSDAVVAASIVTGVPIGVSLNDGLMPTGQVLRVTKLGADARTVLEFDGGNPREQLARAGGDIMLAKFSAGDERVVDIPLLAEDGSAQLLRQHKTGDYFEVLQRQPAPKIFEITEDGVSQAKRRVFVKRPIASLVFPCKAYIPHHEQASLNVEAALARLEKGMKDGPCLGGFFDGELGVDEVGRSRLTNGGVGYVIFGDELRERAALYKGVSALAKHQPKVLAGAELTAGSVYEAIDNALNIVYETGFPGAMISLVRSNLVRSGRDPASDGSREVIVAYKAIGPRFVKIVEHTQRPCEGDDILAIVAREKEARFIPDSTRKDSSCNREAVEMSGLVSQYVLPLKRLNNTVFATLQVDLGDLRHLSAGDFAKTEKARILNCFAEVIGASINRIVNAAENELMMRLDKALNKSLWASSLHEGVDGFVKAAGEAFGAEMGHLWLTKFDDGPADPNDQTLILEAGFGVDDETERESWRKIQSGGFSPICHAYRSGEPQIINDVSGDSAWQAMLACVPRDSELYRSLGAVRSYAAVVFRNEHVKLGAVSLCSTQPWFFLSLHRNALEVLAERLGFIVEHLRAKVRLKFLSDVSPRLAERSLDKARRILQDVTEDFRLALDAKVASLYLWDQDREKYVLRAQSCWKDDRWVHAASYSKDNGWIGVQAINEGPLHVNDLRRHYMRSGYEHPHGRYAEMMFGRPLSEDFTVEAIALPLGIGPEKRNKLGVLTLYRPTEKGLPSGVVTTDINLLHKGAYNAAGLVNAVLRHRSDIWVKDEEERQQAVYKAITSGDDHHSFEAKVCRQVLLTFRAAQVAFYRMDDPAGVVGPSWVVGYSRRPGSQVAERIDAPSDEHRQLLKETARTKRNKIIYQVAERRRELRPEQRSDPEALKTEGLVEQVCIPLTGENKYLAALVISWRLSPSKAFVPRVQHSAYQLQKLGRIIGSTYLRNQITRDREQSEKEREQADLAMRAANAYAAQRGHMLRNILNMIYDRVGAMDDDSAELKELNSLVSDATRIVHETMDLGERVLYPSYERCRLSWLVGEALREERGLLRRRLDGLGIAYAGFVPEDHAVRVDPSNTMEVLFNLINNAAAAIDANKEYGKKVFADLGIRYADFVPGGLMLRVDPSDAKELFNLVRNPADPAALRKRVERMLVAPEIDIRVTSAGNRTVRLAISDNGIGMTEKEVHAAERGFVRSKGHSGVGVLLSRVLLAAQGGNLAFQSRKFKGTRAILTLPSAEMDKTDETTKLDGADNPDRG